MIEHFPDFWQEDPCAAAIVEAVSAEAALVRQNAREILAASCVSTAPEWAVEMWERSYGIAPDSSKSLQARRSAVQALMRGGGIATPERIKQTVTAFHKGEVVIIEDVTAGGFTVEFVGQEGTPAYISDVSAAIDKIKPAHLVYGFAYRYLLLDEVETMTLAQLEALPLDRFAGGAAYG